MVSSQDSPIYVNLLNAELWMKANWQGVTFLMDPFDAGPPRVAFGFLDADAGRAAFADLLEKVGPDDAEGRLRIAFIEGPIQGKLNPAYTITAGPYIHDAAQKAGERVGDALQMWLKIFIGHVRVPRNSPGLDFFKAAYARHRRCRIVPTGRYEQPDPESPLGIWKTDIVIRYAAEIRRGCGDPDEVALM